MTDGVLLLDKALGVTSARAARKVGWLLGIKKVGHGGTLDPAASGLLVMLVGEATPFAGYLLGGDKVYLATIQVGSRSDTDDGDGCLTCSDVAVPANLGEAVGELLPSFTGDIMQTAPAYSALKHAGRQLYDYARKGETPPVKRRQVRIDTIILREVSAASVSLEVHSASGVYIRSLARDIGDALGCGAYLSALRRLQSGHFQVANAVSLVQLESLSLAERQAHILPTGEVIVSLPEMILDAEKILSLGQGRHCQTTTHDDGQWRVVSTSGKFAGVVNCQNGLLRPSRFLHWTRNP